MTAAVTAASKIPPKPLRYRAEPWSSTVGKSRIMIRFVTYAWLRQLLLCSHHGACHHFIATLMLRFFDTFQHYHKHCILSSANMTHLALHGSISDHTRSASTNSVTMFLQQYAKSREDAAALLCPDLKGKSAQITGLDSDAEAGHNTIKAFKCVAKCKATLE